MQAGPTIYHNFGYLQTVTRQYAVPNILIQDKMCLRCSCFFDSILNVRLSKDIVQSYSCKCSPRYSR